MDTKFQKLIVMLAAAAVLASAGAYIKSELGAYTVSVERNTDKTDKITVTVKGAVEREGTYKLPYSSIDLPPSSPPLPILPIPDLGRRKNGSEATWR